jgi:hypothetical protein
MSRIAMVSNALTHRIDPALQAALRCIIRH